MSRVVSGDEFASALQEALGLQHVEHMTDLKIEASWDGDLGKITITVLPTEEMVGNLKEAAQRLQALAEVTIEESGPRRILLQDEDQVVGSGSSVPAPPPSENRTDR